MNILEERGTFWWANKPVGDEQPAVPAEATGVLRISDKGKVSLNMDTQLIPPKEKGTTIVFEGGSINLDGKIICGILPEKNQHVYLCGLWGGFLFQQFGASNCLVGQYSFPSGLNDPTIGKIGIPLDGYEDWFCLNPIKFKDEDNTISFTYKILEEDVYKTKKADIHITYHARYSYGSRAELNPAIYMKYKLKDPLALDEVGKKFRVIEDLFIVLTGSEHCLMWPSVTLLQNGKKYTHYFYRNMNDAKGPSRHESPTNFVMLRDNFEETFKLWEEKSETLGSAFYSYLSTKRGIMLYIEDLFKSLVGGLEAYHRKTTPTSPLTEKKEAKLKRIMDHLHAKDKRWAGQILKRALEEPPLQDRLYEIFKRMRPDLDKKKVRAFAKQCAHDRNDLAHFAGPRDSNDNTELYERLTKASYALSYFYHALILSEIGTDQEILDNWSEKSFSSYRIKSSLVDVNLLDPSVLERQAVKKGG